jgi:endonuclease-8
MPEGPEVKIVTDWLIKYCSGCIIRDNSKFTEINTAVINRIHCKGKHIFFELFVNGVLKYLSSHLAMTGRWTNTRGEYTKAWMVLYNPIVKQDWVLYYDDKRNFGKIILISPQEYQIKLSDIGPDLLSDVIDPKDWYTKIKNNRIKPKMICDFLLEQKYFSGIGNYLKSEILYICKIKPDRPLCSLSDEEINKILEVSLATIRESYSYGGLTIEDFWSPEGKKGVYPCRVYSRKTDDHGFHVITAKLKATKGDRTTHWVAEVQK